MTLLLGCGGSGGSGPGDASQPEQPQPNVLVWLVDTLRADHLGCYGYARPTSPRLDALATAGVLFSNAHVHSNWTMPSVTSLYSGRYPPIFGQGFDVTVPASITLAAECFAAAGYDTAGFTITVATAAAFGFDRGYGTYVELDGQASDAERRARTGPAFDAERVVDAALAWLDGERQAQRPFLLTLHSVDPHVPYEPHTSVTPFGAAYDGPLDGQTETLRDALASGYQPTPADIAAVTDLYDGEVAYSDAQLGRLVDGLDQRGLLAHTLLVVVSDHGEELWDRHTHGHGHRNLHAELTRVPLVLHWPSGLAAGLRVDGLMRGIDLLPTLLELCGLPPLPGVDGVSVANVIAARGDLHGRNLPLYAHRAKDALDVMALRSEHQLYHADPSGRFAGLYDLTADPDARHDLRAADRDAEQQPKAALFAWLRAQGRRRAADDAARQTVELDAETEAALRALGYLGDDG